MGYNLFQDMGALIEATEFDFGLKAQVHDFPFRGTSLSRRPRPSKALVSTNHAPEPSTLTMDLRHITS